MKVMKPSIRTMDTRTVRPAPKSADPELQTLDHEIWRSIVVRRADFQCEEIENGQRCEVKAPATLFADHIIERRDGGDALDPANGRCLCGRHHSLKTARVRAQRMKAEF